MKSKSLSFVQLACALALLMLAVYGLQAFSANNAYHPAELLSVAAQAETPSVPTSPISPTINITRAQWADALAKWRSQGIEDYEAVVNLGVFSSTDGRYTLRVRGDDIQAIKFLQYGHHPVTPVPGSTESLRPLTIESQFRAIEHALDTRPWNVGESKDDFPFAYYVEFDPILGYPRKLNVNALPNPNTGRMIEDAFYSIETESLKVLKRNLPGMPRTGHPER